MKKILWISEECFSLIVAETEKYDPLETGGVFMGYVVDNDLVVTDIIFGGPNAYHGKTKFIPDQDYQLEEIEKIFYRSDTTVTYLGDWHSHPSSTSSLSLLDKRTLTKIATTDEANCKNPIMLILGKKPEKWSANVVKFLSGKLFVWPFVSCNYEPLDIKVYND